jgi:hypothetical protein
VGIFRSGSLLRKSASSSKTRRDEGSGAPEDLAPETGTRLGAPFVWEVTWNEKEPRILWGEKIRDGGYD